MSLASDELSGTNHNSGAPQSREAQGGRFEQNEDTGAQTPNVGDAERIASVVGGGLLALSGLARRGVPGLVAVGVGGAMLYRGVTGWCSLYKTLGINTAEETPEQQATKFHERGIHVEQSYSINKNPEELFAFWRDFENLPKFMYYLDEVRVTGEKTSHWVAKGPAGKQVKWDAEIINEIPNQLIAWRSLPGATVDNTGSVRFLPGQNGVGTDVRVVIDYVPPGGVIGATIAKIFGRDVQSEVKEDLRRFKQLMETGEIPTIEGQPRGTCGA